MNGQNDSEGGKRVLEPEDKYRGLTEEEREEERRKMEAWNERRERGPGYAAPLCGGGSENAAFMV